MVARADNMYLKKEKHSNANNGHANIDMNLFTENAHNGTYKLPHSELVIAKSRPWACYMCIRQERRNTESF